MYRIIGDLLNWKIAIHAPKGKCIIQLMYVHMIVVFYIENHSSICPNLEVNNFNFLICLSCDLKEGDHSVALLSKKYNFWKLFCIARRYCFFILLWTELSRRRILSVKIKVAIPLTQGCVIQKRMTCNIFPSLSHIKWRECKGKSLH